MFNTKLQARSILYSTHNTKMRLAQKAKTIKAYCTCE